MAPPLITSIHNPRVKRAARLRDRRGRKQQNRMLVDGLREIQRACTAGIETEELYVCESMLDAMTRSSAMELAATFDVEIMRVTEEVFRKLAFGQRAEGVVLVGIPPKRRLDDLSLDTNAMIAVLESVEKPGNLGAVLRSADAAGVSAVVVADALTDLYHPNAIRASLGAVFTVPVCAASTDEVIRWIRQRHVATFAARVDGAVPYTEVDYRQPCAVVLGREATGLSAAWHDSWVTPIKLPMLGTVDSLNVSVTAAVLFFEALRQRQNLGNC
jgi:TrmH family RNA methyltransferase